MQQNLQETIILKSEQLFRKYGYNKTSMRMIANECGISVGNLCYHYPKKEDLLMEHHNILMDSFLDLELFQGIDILDPWTEYFASEYCFLLRISRDKELMPIFKEVINVTALREAYYQKHTELFLKFFSPSDFELSEEMIYLSTVALSALEFQFLDLLFSEETSDRNNLITDIMIKILKTRPSFLGLNPEDFNAQICNGMRLGLQSVTSTDNKTLFYGSSNQ